MYKGVCYRPSQSNASKYEAVIQKEGKAYRKRFSSEIAAALWYNKMAKELYGDIAYQNKI